ncbi:pyrimidine utilization protein D [Beijerinckia sp. L45]|uniref:pyrimidine utilization protein D n=1 Tax=Beijerinckia sp. L45 TaxID=1641855 RepID=UPI001577113C|nr:pyrimidine utilization protein D [Beijerinckia sp. L45]
MMHYEVVGRADAAETVLLSSGLGGAGAFWQPQLAALSERYRVVLYDQRGTGRNTEPLPDGYSIGAMADDVIEILDHLDVARCAFVGHALGGIVGLDLALRYPNRLTSLVPVNAWAKTDGHTAMCFAVRKDLLLHVGPAAYVRAQPIFLYPAPWLSQNAERLAREEAHGIAHFQGADTLLKRIGALLAFDVSARLGEITVPTLVAASRDDILVPWTASERLADGIPTARLWVTPEGGHGFTVTEPEIFNAALLRFLDEAA